MKLHYAEWIGPDLIRVYGYSKVAAHNWHMGNITFVINLKELIETADKHSTKKRKREEKHGK